MVKQTLGALALGAATLACSGRYYEIGRMDATGGVNGTSGAASGATLGGSSSSSTGSSETVDPGSGASTASGNAGPATAAGGSAAQCVASGAPPKLTGAFAEPQEVWRRVAMLTYGKPTPALSKLPATTTYDWAAAAVALAMQDAKKTLSGAPGAETFLRQALELDASAKFREPWAVLLSSDNSVLNALLLAPLDEPGRVGIFTEPSWLLTKTSISSRGVAIYRVLLGQVVPSPPGSAPPLKLDPNLPDRVALQAVTMDAVCNSCHSFLDPPGFALGHFAADGSYRELDHGLPIDTTGSIPGDMYESPTDFDGIADFGGKFAESCVAQRSIAVTFLRAALVINGAAESEQPALVDDNAERVAQAFVNGPQTYASLVQAYIQSPAGLGP